MRANSTSSQSSSTLSSPQASPTQAICLSPQQTKTLASNLVVPNIYSVNSLSGQANGGGHLLSPSAIKSLKFSIENILKPEFGRTDIRSALQYTINSINFLSSHSSSSSSSSSTSSAFSSLTSFTSSPSSSSSKKNATSHNNNVGLPTPIAQQSSNTNLHINSNDNNNISLSSPPSSAVNVAVVETVHKQGTKRSSFDISSLTGKRKHSSDSECSTTSSSFSTTSKESGQQKKGDKSLWPAWVYCTRYSDRPSSGPRSRRMKKKEKKSEEKRPRTAFTADQLARLKQEFQENRYLTERRRQDLARDLKLNESQIKIWFQNKRAKIKKSTGSRNPLALHLMAQGLYNHSTMAVDGDEDDNCDNDDDDEMEMIADDQKADQNASVTSTSSPDTKNR